MSSGVIVGYDGSETAKAALRAAIEVGHAYGEKVVIAVAYDLSPVGGEIYDYLAALKELADKRVAEAAALATAEGGNTEVEGVVVEQEPARALAELATERDARVIVVGTRGESPLRGALLGSTPHKLLHLADRPVLVVPAAER
jgi:nucleotide-binding universal stress UspA family protein